MLRLVIYDNSFNLLSVSADATEINYDASLLNKIASKTLYVKNPLLHDAELMTKIKGWQIPKYIPRLLLMAKPGPKLFCTKPNTITQGYYDIPLGLLSTVRDFVVENKIKVKVLDSSLRQIKITDSKIIEKDYISDPRLRDYQNEAVLKLSTYKRAQAVSMTGSGKTIIMSSLIKHFDMPTVILCHRKLLINQWKEAIKFIIGKNAYTLVGGKVTKGDCEILIASMQSIGAFSEKSEKSLLSKRISDPILNNITTASMPAANESVLKLDKLYALEKAGLDLLAFENLLVIVDEAHVAPAFGFYNIVSSLCPTLLYGCTATPNRTDGRTIFSHAIFTNRTVETDVDEVKKHLTPLQYITVEVSDMFDDAVTMLNSESVIMDAEFTKILASDPRRFAQIIHAIKQLVLHGYTAVIICGNNLWLVDALADALNYNNIAHGIITGATKDIMRKKIVDGIESRDLKILLATTTIDVGVDITTLDAAVFPVPFSGETVSIQRAGRIVRRAPGKDKCMIIDFKDCLVPKAIGAYVHRKRHIIKTFGAISSDVIRDYISDIQGLDPEWTRVINLKEN